MKTELWGTSSVKDHLRERPFVAEVLLYDRLMIPRPPTLEEEEHQPGRESQLKRWRRLGWSPQRQRELLDILQEGNLAVELPWGQQARQDWYDLYHGSEAEQVGTGREICLQNPRKSVLTSCL